MIREAAAHGCASYGLDEVRRLMVKTVDELLRNVHNVKEVLPPLGRQEGFRRAARERPAAISPRWLFDPVNPPLRPPLTSRAILSESPAALQAGEFVRKPAAPPAGDFVRSLPYAGDGLGYSSETPPRNRLAALSEVFPKDMSHPGKQAISTACATAPGHAVPQGPASPPVPCPGFARAGGASPPGSNPHGAPAATRSVVVGKLEASE